MQQFPSNGGEIQTIGIQFATYRRVNTGTVFVTIQALRNGQWLTLGGQSVDKETLQDNAFQRIRFTPPLSTEKGELLTFTIASDGPAQQGISVWLNPEPAAQQLQLYTNGSPQQGTVFYYILYKPQTGPLIFMLQPLWRRLTIFLSPIWQVALLGGLLLIVALLHTLLRTGIHMLSQRMEQTSE